MVELRIENKETEQEINDRFSHAELREMLGKVAKDMIQYGTHPDAADAAVAHLFAALSMMEAGNGTSLGMVLQALRNVHRPRRYSAFYEIGALTPNDLLHGALHANNEARFCLMVARRHPDTPPAVVAMIQAAMLAHDKIARFIQEPMWATDPPEVEDMEPAGNA